MSAPRSDAGGAGNDGIQDSRCSSKGPSGQWDSLRIQTRPSWKHRANTEKHRRSCPGKVQSVPAIEVLHGIRSQRPVSRIPGVGFGVYMSGYDPFSW